MKILLVRHGESRHNVNPKIKEDSVLTRKGRIQAKYLGEKLKKQKISAIYTSNLLRAKETGEIISKIIKAPIKGTFGELDEYPTRTLRSRLNLLFNKRFKELKKLLNKIAKNRNKDKTILIVAHGITNKLTIGYLLNLPLKKQLLRFHQSNTGINTLIWSKYFNNWAVDSMNDISHLQRKLGAKFK